MGVIEIGPNELEHLGALLDERKLAAGTAVLVSQLEGFRDLAPATPGAGRAISLLAKWKDLGFEDAGLLETLLDRFPAECLVELPVGEYVQIRLAQAAVAMHKEDVIEALSHLDFILAFGQDIADQKTIAFANSWKARCLRKAGEYDSALEFAQKARRIASESAPKLAAVIRTLESWLLFQKGSSKEAVRILQDAEATLRDSDDFITLGNIQSAYGRIARREGRYEQALQYFQSSIEIFKDRPALERHYARSLTNIAKTKRLLALELRRRMELDRERKQHSRHEPASGSQGSKSRDLERMRQWLSEARAQLAEAEDLFRRFPSHHGAGNVQVGMAEIALDLDHLEEADQAALRAFELGGEKQDYLLMCRARIGQAMIANARYEGQIGEPERCAQLALDCAREAVAFAEHTQSRRILARAYISEGLVLMNGFFNNPELARSCAEKAEELLRVDRHGALWEDLKALQAKILRRSKLDPNLRAWSQGIVGGKSLQQVVEEFEALLISKVWEREERRVSRVAQRLSVSPKKVRRLLRRLGLLSAEDEDAGIPSRPYT